MTDVFDLLHLVLNFVLFGSYSDLGWAGVRALSMFCALVCAWAYRSDPDRWMYGAALFLGTLLGLKVMDDLAQTAQGTNRQTLTVFFLFANLAWSVILLRASRRANRDRVQAGRRV